MKIKDGNGRLVPYTGISRDKIQAMIGLIENILSQKDQVLICMTGNKGSGKTTLGKFFRKNGLGPFGPRQIAVIDDDCMSVDLLFFLRRKYVSPCRGVDELQPFLRYCRKKRVRFYVKSNPESRITQADIVLNLTISEPKRKERLIQRYGEPKATAVFNQTLSYSAIPVIDFQYTLTAELS